MTLLEDRLLIYCHPEGKKYFIDFIQAFASTLSNPPAPLVRAGTTAPLVRAGTTASPVGRGHTPAAPLVGQPTTVSHDLGSINPSDYDLIIIVGLQYVLMRQPEYKIYLQLPKDKVIIYNTEQLPSEIWNFMLPFMAQCRAIWDYAPANIAYLKKKDIETGYFVPLQLSPSYKIKEDGLCPASRSNGRPGATADSVGIRPQPTGVSGTSLTSPVGRGRKCNEEKKLIFIGEVNQRREEIFKKITEMGVELEIYNNTAFGDKYKEIVANNKYFLNVHFYQPSILEVFRIVPLLSNDKVVISEPSDDQELDQFYQKHCQLHFFNKVSEIPNILAAP